MGLSAHYMLRAKILFPWKGRWGPQARSCSVEGIVAPRYKLYLLAEDSIRGLYASRLEEKIDLNQGSSLSEKYDHLCECIHSAAREALGVDESRKQPDWWSEEVADLVNAKKEAYQRYLASNSSQDWIAYRALSKRVKEAVAEGKNAFWERCCRKIDGTLGFNRVRETWGILKSLRAPRKGNVVSPISEAAWKKHYETLLNESRAEFITRSGGAQESPSPSPPLCK